jgi:putative ABC transport system ATP-binding protein
VLLPLELAGQEAPESRARELLERVGLGDRLHHTPRQLSGGEQQRVAIARAFACDPVVLFADEPTGNLDNRTGQAVSDLLMALNREQGTTLVMVTHDEQLAARCGRQLHIEAGRLSEPAVAGGEAP